MRAQGIDISKWQVSYDSTIKAHDFVFIKGTENIGIDPLFEQHAGEIANVPVRGVYHFFRSIGVEDSMFWKKQADHFLGVVEPHDFDVLFLDFERKNNQPSIRFGEGARQWLDYVKEASGKKTLLYSNPASYQEYLVQYGQKWMNNYDFWVAQYPFDRRWDDQLNNAISGDWHPRLPAGHHDWKFWQFSADGNQKGPENGIPRQPWNVVPPAVDLDVFNGTVSQLHSWLGIEPGVDGGVVGGVAATYPGKTNQNMIDYIYEAAAPFTIDPWNDWIVRANLESLAIPDANRYRPYTGPEIKDLPGLTRKEKRAIQAVMKGEPIPDLQGEPTYPDMTNQDIINLIFKAAAPSTSDPWSEWIVPAGLEYLAIPDENRTKPYTGPKIKDLSGLDDIQKTAILAEV